jgi:ankyrin repeat protein
MKLYRPFFWIVLGGILASHFGTLSCMEASSSSSDSEEDNPEQEQQSPEQIARVTLFDKILFGREDNIQKTRKLIQETGDINIHTREGDTLLHCIMLLPKEQEARATALLEELINRNAPISAQNNVGKTPLHEAVQCKRLSRAHLLLAQHPEKIINIKDQLGRTALHLAAQHNLVDMPKLLQEEGADLDAQDNEGFTPLHLAVQQGLLGTVTRLIGLGANIYVQDNQGRTPLYWAITKNRQAITKIFINKILASLKGGMVDASIDHTGSPLLWAAVSVGTLDQVKTLIQKGARLDRSGPEGGSPLHVAARIGSTAMVDILIEKGHPLDSKNDVGSTPLLVAAFYGHETAAAQLIEQGANQDSINNKGITLLHAAARGGCKELVIELIDKHKKSPEALDLSGRTPLFWAASAGKTEVYNVLIERGAHAHITDLEGLTVFHAAAASGSQDLVLQLIDAYEVDVRDTFDETPLHLAAAFGHETIATFLIDHKAAIDARTICRQTPLHLAAKYGQQKVALELIKHGADINARDIQERTPLHWASYNGHKDMVKVLLKQSKIHIMALDRALQSPRDLAFMKGHAKIVKRLAKMVDPFFTIIRTIESLSLNKPK